MFVAEEELAIEIAKVNRIKINDVDLAEAGQDEVFEQLAADAASTDHQHARLVFRQYGRASFGALLLLRAGCSVTGIPA